MLRLVAVPVVLFLAACSTDDEPVALNEQVVLRNLTETEVARPKPEYEPIQGELIPTPSDPAGQYYLLRHRTTLVDTTIAILREEKGGRVAYARTEVDCARRLFHVVGVASTRGRVESDVAHDGPLRSISGLPLRQELAGYICDRAGTPLAT